MIIEKESVNRIKDYFSLNLYEAKVWLALLSKGIASAGEISEISKVPRSRTYDVLESLEKKGFVLVKLGKPAKYLGIKPIMVLERMKNSIKSDAEEKMVRLSNIKETYEYKELEKLHNEGSNPIKKEEFSLALKGKSNISSYLREILENSTTEVILCLDAFEMKNKLKLFEQTIKILKKNKIEIKIALNGPDKIISEIKKSLNLKIIKTKIQAKFFIIDKKEILFYISRKDSEDSAVWINSEFFVNAFSELFDKSVEIKDIQPK